MLAALCACDVRRTGGEPLEECTTYASHAQACLGERVGAQLRASFAKPPEGEAAREKLRAECVAQVTRLRSACR